MVSSTGFLWAGCPSCLPTNSVAYATKGKNSQTRNIFTYRISIALTVQNKLMASWLRNDSVWACMDIQTYVHTHLCMHWRTDTQKHNAIGSIYRMGRTIETMHSPKWYLAGNWWLSCWWPRDAWSPSRVRDSIRNAGFLGSGRLNCGSAAFNLQPTFNKQKLLLAFC